MYIYYLFMSISLRYYDKTLLPDSVAEMLKLADCYAVLSSTRKYWTVGDCHGGVTTVRWRNEVRGWTSSDFALAIQELLRRQARSGSKPIMKVTRR